MDTARYHYLAWKRLANELNYDLTEAENERLKGVSRMESLDIILSLAGVTRCKEERELLAGKKNVWFNNYVEDMTPEEIFPGVMQLIRDLKRERIKVGLASSSKNASKVLRQLKIENEFDAIVDGSMIAHTKPDPEIFLLTAERLNLAPSSCVVIEDAEAGVEAALASGMTCIGIGSPVILKKATKVFPKTSDIKPSIVREMATSQGKDISRD